MKVLQITRNDLIASYIEREEAFARPKVLEDPLDAFAFDHNDSQFRELRFFQKHADNARRLFLLHMNVEEYVPHANQFFRGCLASSEGTHLLFPGLP